MTRKLLQKAGLVQMPAMTRPEPTAPSAESARAKTAPGSMIHFMSAQSAAVREADDLRERLAGFDGAHPVRRLDAKSIRVSGWANRHPASFGGPSFAELKSDIASAGGIVQPIKVRPVEPPVPGGVGRSNPPGKGLSETYEIVYGHRRHRACLELGLPVLALIEDVPEHQLFVEMERENRSREDLSAWEQGCMYARALDQGLFASNRQLASSIGRDLGDVGKALALARLPQAVIDAFDTPLDLQYRWAKPLSDAQRRDPEALVRRAKALKQARPLHLAAKQVFESLIADPGVGPSNPQASSMEIKSGTKVLATVRGASAQRTLISIDVALTPERRNELLRLLRKFLST